jgi:hypothetical protein
MVFNEAAMRQEVALYLWGMGFVPSPTELYPQTNDVRLRGGLMIELPHTHWALARNAFAARPDLIQRIRPEVRQLMGSVPRRPATWVARPQRTSNW